MNQKKTINHFFVYVLLVFFIAIFLVPAYMVVITSLKSPAQIDLAPFLLNSVYLVVPATLLSSLLGSLNGYVLSKWKFKGSKILFQLMLFGMFIPYQSILIPLFQFLNWVGLYGNIPGLVLVHVVYGLPITTLIFRNYYAEAPPKTIFSGFTP